MPRDILKKLGYIMNFITLLLIMGIGMIIHTLTALTLKSYYGDPWGYISFLFPGFSEAYLMVIQLGDDMYNYTMLLAAFIVMTIFWIVTKFFSNRLVSSFEN